MTSVVDMRSACRRAPKIAGIENAQAENFKKYQQA
ncbi:MAG: hypothetical protein ACI89D_001268 [Bermanella sp.]|jgi:hypothetical protein